MLPMLPVLPVANGKGEAKRQKLSERLKRQGRAFAQTLWELRSLDPSSPYTVLHSEAFDGGGVVITGTAGKFKVTEVK